MAKEGSGEPELVVWNQNISDVLKVEFEEFRLVSDYYGIYSLEAGVVEAFLETSLVTAPVRAVLEHTLGGSQDNSEAPSVELNDQGVKVELAPPSQELLALVGSPDVDVRSAGGTSIKVSGVTLAGEGTPKAVLERYADSLLFQFDTKFQRPLVLARRQQSRLPSLQAIKKREGDLTFPVSEFDHEPMSLYWYGRGAHGLPLLEFFAYYQVLEFYYEHYVEAEGRRRVAQVLKNPGFSPHDDRYVSQVLRAAGRGSGNRRNERDQLLTTIRGCADAGEIRNFIRSDEDREKFFEEKDLKLSGKTIQVAVSDNELLQQVADRVYDLRCKIVHTKEGGSREGVELLLPHSPEAGRLHRDIDLLRLIARQALIATSRPMP